MKKILIILIAVIVGVLFYFAFLHKTAEAPNIPEEENTNESKSLEVKESKREVFGEGYEIDFKFPVTNNEKINSEINKVVDQLVTTFEDEAKGFLPNDISGDRNYVLIGSYEAHLGSDYDTFVFLTSVDFGGAHPNHFYKTITFDKYNTVVSLEKFLNEKFGGLEVVNKISEKTRNIISAKLGEDTNVEMLKAGTEPKLDNFRNFYIDGESIVFLFEPYAVAPYAYSTQEAKINFSDLMI